MNDNDIADQLRLQYRMQRLQRNQKWWWALWLWGFEVLLVNSYRMYKRYCELCRLKIEYSHHDWREKIGCALLNPDKEWPSRRNSNDNNVSAKRSRSTSPVPPSSKKPKFTNNSLCRDGSLNCRLDKSFDHMPVVPPGKKDNWVCQLHRWAGSKVNGGKIPPGSRNCVMHCKACGVNVCLQCWELYHSEPDLQPHIETILKNK